jgi:uncharacterized protein YbjT (DUF2867 family)
MIFTVAGATGRLLPLTPTLLAHGHGVRVVTRETGSSTARELRALGAEIWRGDFDEPRTLVPAAEGADALFVAGTAHRVGPDGEARQGIAAADAAKASGVAQFVYLSGSGAGVNTGVPVFAAKHAVEAHIQSRGLPYTIIAPVYFMENLLNPWNLPALRAGIFPSPVGVRRSLQQVAIADVAAFTRLVLERPEAFLGERVEIASDELTAAAAAQALSRAAGRHFEAQRLSLERLPDGLARLFGWLERIGDDVDIEALHDRYAEVGWHSFERWAEAQDWRGLARAGRAAVAPGS